MSYWPLGVWLNRTGSFTVSLISSRGPFLPAVSAIHVAFGSDWAYVIYPMLGATLLYWCALSLLSGPLSTAAAKTARLVAGGAVLFLVLEPSFLFHSFFVHSHMVSAVCLLMSLTSIWLAVRPTAPSAGPPSNAYLVLAGVFAAGFALARPDGLAYQFVPVVAAISALTVSEVRWRSVVAFFAPLLALEGLAYGAAYWQLGMWKAGKLGGEMTAAILVVLALSAAGPWIVEWLDRRLPFRVAGERFFGIVTAVAAGLMLAVFVWKWDKASSRPRPRADQPLRRGRRLLPPVVRDRDRPRALAVHRRCASSALVDATGVSVDRAVLGDRRTRPRNAAPRAHRAGRQPQPSALPRGAALRVVRGCRRRADPRRSAAGRAGRSAEQA